MDDAIHDLLRDSGPDLPTPPQPKGATLSFLRDTGGNWGQARPEHRRPDQRKRQRSPLVLSPEQVKLGLAELEFRDQLLVFLDGALGIRQGNSGLCAGSTAISRT